jgi:hypothetical protein
MNPVKSEVQVCRRRVPVLSDVQALSKAEAGQAPAIANQIQGRSYGALRSPLLGRFVLNRVWVKIFINNSLANMKSLP